LVCCLALSSSMVEHVSSLESDQESFMLFSWNKEVEGGDESVWGGGGSLKSANGDTCPGKHGNDPRIKNMEG
jgi:hypothetical protein